jgi:signal transduction histidine kinase
MRIRDNGRGFSTDGASSGLGLGTMRERAQMIGAAWEIFSQLGQGTEITVTWAATGVGKEQVV